MIAQAPVIPPTHKPQAFLDPVTEFYERLLPVKTVEAMYVERQIEGLQFWLIVHKSTEVEREQIYAQELILMQSYPGLAVDTHLIDRSEVDPGGMVDLAAVDVFLRFPRPI